MIFKELIVPAITWHNHKKCPDTKADIEVEAAIVGDDRALGREIIDAGRGHALATDTEAVGVKIGDTEIIQNIFFIERKK